MDVCGYCDSRIINNEYMKTWKPDTCECLVEEIYSGTTITGGGQVLNKCTAHTSVEDEDLYGVLQANFDSEGKRKNGVERILLSYDVIKDLGLEEMKKDDQGLDAGLGFKPGVKYIWSFQGTGANRTLQVEVVGGNLTLLQKTEIETLCNTKFGINKVEVI